MLPMVGTWVRIVDWPRLAASCKRALRSAGQSPKATFGNAARTAGMADGLTSMNRPPRTQKSDATLIGRSVSPVCWKMEPSSIAHIADTPSNAAVRAAGLFVRELLLNAEPTET